MDRRLLPRWFCRGYAALLYRNLDPNFSAAQLIDSNDTLQNSRTI